MARITAPLAASAATLSAAANVPPEEMPHRSPSLRARARAFSIASASVTATIWCATSRSSTAGMKSGVHPWILCGAQGLPARSAAPAGSQAMMRGSGRGRRIICPAPVRVPARPPSGHETIEAPADEVLKDLRSRRVAVIGRIGLVLELPREEPAVLLRQLLGLSHHARAPLGRRRQEDLGAEHAHQLAPLDRERLGHDRDERIALGGAHHREGDAGVAGGRLDHRLARLERAGTLRVLDDGDRQAILDRGHGIEELALHVEGDVCGCQSLDAYDRGLADRAENAVVDHDVLFTLPAAAPTRRRGAVAQILWL